MNSVCYKRNTSTAAMFYLGYILVYFLWVLKDNIVLSADCPAPQVFKTCPTACPPKCSDPFSLSPTLICPAVCGKAGCYCPGSTPIEVRYDNYIYLYFFCRSNLLNGLNYGIFIYHRIIFEICTDV